VLDFSIIVPAYNSDKYILECAESVLTQSLDNLELIIVDDGSDDDTGDLVLGINDARVRYVKTEHAGASSARNAGLRFAQGRYVVLVDSDDYIEPDSLERFAVVLKKYGEVNIVMGSLRSFEDKTGKPSGLFDETPLPADRLNAAEKGDIMDWLRIENIYTCFVTRYAFLRSFILRSDLFFVPGILCEDEEWACRALVLAETIKFTGTNHYVHRIRERSLSSDRSMCRYISLLRIIITLRSLCLRPCVTDAEKAFILDKCNYYMWVLPDEKTQKELLSDNEFRAYVSQYAHEITEAMTFLTYAEETDWLRQVIQEISGFS
jgi:glycosyltransferase involved in cell wall biosynthesis